MPMDRENRPARPGAPRKRRKVCQFCVDKCEHIDYKDAAKHRHLRHASAPADRGHQARPSDRPAALRDRVSEYFCCERKRGRTGPRQSFLLFFSFLRKMSQVVDRVPDAAVPGMDAAQEPVHGDSDGRSNDAGSRHHSKAPSIQPTCRIWSSAARRNAFFLARGLSSSRQSRAYTVKRYQWVFLLGGLGPA